MSNTAAPLNITFTATLGRVREGDTWTCVQLTGMLTDASATREPIRRTVLESLALPTRRSMALAVRSFILNRVDVTAELADLRVPSLFVASDDRGDWSPGDAGAAAALAPGARAVTVSAARTLIPLEQPESLASHVREFWGSADHPVN